MKINFKYNKLSENRVILIAHLIILLYYIPYFLLGANANILIHDNLDSNIAWVKILLDNDAIFNNPSVIIDSVLDGLPVYGIYGTYDISLLIFKSFGMYHGYVINRFLVSIIGFWGMLLLVRRHFLTRPYSSFVLVSSSLIFALLPFWSFSASVLGLPFVVFAFLNLRENNNNIYNWLIILTFPFYSSLVLSGIFLLLLLSIIFLYDLLKKKKVNWYYFTGIIVLSLAYFISHFPLFYGFLFDSFKSHRIEFHQPSIGFRSALDNSFNLFIKGQYHAHSLHNIIIIPIILILIFWYKTFSKKEKLILWFIFLTSLFYGFQNHHLIKPAIEKLTNILPIQLQRFHFLHPMLWYILLAICLNHIVKKGNYGKISSIILLTIQLTYVIKNHEIWKNRRNPTFKEFYSEETFTKIKHILNKPVDDYKVISVGIHPAVAQYNGFKTLDGYFPSYPLKYKHLFRKIIQGELARDEHLRNYFDDWGSRCYAFSSEKNKDHIDSLKYNYQQLISMGGKYIFSATSINESINRNLKLIDIVSTHNNHWNVHIYEVQTTHQ